VEAEDGKKYRILRRQYAMTPGYAFTDYKSQGQTIIIDIGRPPTRSLSPFSWNVCCAIKELGERHDQAPEGWDFDDELFQHHPSEALRLDMERLEALNRLGKQQWENRNTHD